MMKITSSGFRQGHRAWFLAARFRGLSTAALGLIAACVLSGCAANYGVPAAGTMVGTALNGSVHGGQQPITGATIQLYAASTTGYSAVATALLTSSVSSDSNGNFNITNDYTCPSAATLVYLTALGGNPGGGTNPNAALMAPLGACGSLTSSTFISVNELTTVAGAFALAPFMSNARSLGTSSTNVTGLTNAFSSVNKLVNVSLGQSPGTLPTGATAPTSKLNTLGDILAACINSTGGVAGDGSACGTLFANSTPPGGAAPTDTVTAALNIAKYPGSNVTALANLATAASPFQPTATGLADFTLAVKYAPAATFSTPSASAVDSAGNLWVANKGNNSITVLSATTALPTILTGGTLRAPSSIAFDQNGNAWVPNSGNSTLSVFTPAGAGSLSSATGLSTPTSIAIDGQNILWIANSGNSSITESVVSGTSVSSTNNFSGTAGISGPVGVAINAH